MSRRLEVLYTQLYNEGQAVLDNHNTCNFDPVAKTCRAGPLATHGCCRGCEHLGPKGCTVKALTCKLWLCPTAVNAKPQAQRELRQIELRAWDAGIPYSYRASKAQHMADRYED
jgi:hypothetical protein